MTKLCLLLMIAMQLQVQAQKRGQEYLDSMVADIPTAKEDTNKVKLLYRIGNGYSGTDAAKSEYYILQCIELSKKLGWQKGVASGYNTLGDLQLNTGVSDSAFYYYNLCYQINKEIGNQEGVVWALSDLGDYEDRRSNAVGAIKYYMDALPAAEKTGKPKMVSMLYSHISTVYYHQDNFDKAASFISKAMAIDKTAGDDSKMAEYAEMLGNISNSKHDSASALKYYFQALELHTAADHKLGIATLYQQLGTVLPTVNERIAYKIKARNLWDSISPGHLLAVVNIGNLGYDYFLMEKNKLLVKPDVNIPSGKNERLALAEKYLTEAVSLAKAGDDPDDQQYFSLILSELYQEKGDYKKALDLRIAASAMRDSIYSQDVKNKMAAIEGEREIALRDNAIALNAASLKAQKRQRIALLAGIGLLVVIGVLLYRQSRTRKKTNTTLTHLNNELDEANKVKARFFAILSHDLRSPVANLVSFLELQQEPGLMDAAQTAAHQQQIAASARGLLDNMEAMLLWSKGQMEQFRPQVQQVPVKDLFSYLESFFPSTQNIRFSFTDAHHAVVNTDENYLRTIMYNLTANAARVLQDKPNSTVEWKATVEHGKTILSISDNGPGISEEQVKALYTESIVPNTKTGFGLHLIRDLAKAIGCSISLEKGTAAGATFRLVLQSFAPHNR